MKRLQFIFLFVFLLLGLSIGAAAAQNSYSLWFVDYWDNKDLDGTPVANDSTGVIDYHWNGSPKDDKGQPGPFEQSIIGTKVKDKDNPYELVRIVRAFDPCLACAVHLLDARGNKLRVFKVV